MKNATLNSNNKLGQGIVEYVILVGLIAIIVWAMIETLGSNLSTRFSTYAQDISGIKNSIN